MPEIPKDPEIEDRIATEVIVDAYGPEDQAMGWYTALGDRLAFPFAARCVAERSTSPLGEGEDVEVVGMADAEDCQCEMFVEAAWQGRTLSVPLSQLKALDPDPDTEQALGDWRYWTARGYSLC